jgi:hypothetical protein
MCACVVWPCDTPLERHCCVVVEFVACSVGIKIGAIATMLLWLISLLADISSYLDGHDRAELSATPGSQLVGGGERQCERQCYRWEGKSADGSHQCVCACAHGDAHVCQSSLVELVIGECHPTRGAVYRFTAMFLLLGWFWGCCVWIWSKFRINYVYIFEMDRYARFSLCCSCVVSEGNDRDRLTGLRVLRAVCILLLLAVARA